MRVQLWWCDSCSLPLSCLSVSVLIILKLRENITGHSDQGMKFRPFSWCYQQKGVLWHASHLCLWIYSCICCVCMCRLLPLQMPVLIKTNIICCAVSESFWLGFLGPCGGLFLSQSPHFIWDSSLHIFHQSLEDYLRVFGSHLLSSEEWGTESHRVALPSSPLPLLQLVNLNVCLPLSQGYQRCSEGQIN